ncbi:MAG: alpha/beta hydrolase [Gordonia sp. (in: high G+C Gram-positive bacteria)]|uniref:alpha/beta hydrolase n=1 Tax=Gordonia sp. (in: high G+C Gram-positive bacteria) TaxID=84139 RepID=UPI0039E72322
MNAGIAEIRAWPLERIAHTATRFDSGATRVLTSTGTVVSTLDGAPPWTGATRDAVGRRVGIHSTSGKRLTRMLGDVSDLVGRAVAQLGPARTSLLQWVETAETAGFQVSDSGAVTHPSPRRRADADLLQSRIRALLDRLHDIDGRTGARLRLLSGMLAGDGTHLPHPDGGWGDPVDVVRRLQKMTPEKRRDYWESLSRPEATTLTRLAPEVIGNMPGIPFPSRIAANDISIRRALEREVNHGRPHSDRAEELRRMLAPAAGVDGEPVKRRFVAFSDRGLGRYIEQVGDLKPGISGVGVLVPGTGTNLESSSRDRTRALHLARESGAPVFVFADGALPQRVTPPWYLMPAIGAFDDTAVDGEPAKRLGRDLVTFGEDLDAEVAMHAAGTEVTYIGHSYGGSVVGTADRMGLRADRIVFASSAGTGAVEGGVDPGVERYSITPPGDPIHWAQKFGGAVHGGDPDTTPGIKRLDSGFYSPDGPRAGQPVRGFPAHSDYLDDPGSTAFGNLVAVLSGGRPTEYVEREPDLPEVPERTRRRVQESAMEMIGDFLKESVIGALRLPGLAGR